MTKVPRAAQRNHHSARRGELVERLVASGFGAELGEGGHLHEVEVVEQADPGDAEQDVEPAESLPRNRPVNSSSATTT